MEKRHRISRFVWVPRIIAIAFIIYLLVFTLDIGGSGLWDKIVAFVMHALPSIFMAICLAVFWRHPKASGFIFLVIAVIFTFWFNTYGRMDSFLMLSVPPLAIGILFLATRVYK